MHQHGPFLWSYSANHSPGAVDELIFYGVCKPTFIRANCKHTRYINFKKHIVFIAGGGLNPLLGLFRLAMSPKSASYRPKHA